MSNKSDSCILYFYMIPNSYDKNWYFNISDTFIKMVKPAPFHAGDLVFAKVRFFISKKEEIRSFAIFMGLKTAGVLTWVGLIYWLIDYKFIQIILLHIIINSR